jgi:hypothetical protein
VAGLDVDDALDDEVDDPSDPDLPLTFSGFKSIVTGRFEPVDEVVDDVLPGLPDAPVLLPSDDDVPPGDFLSVAMCTPLEPDRSQDHYYTRLVVKRYRCGKESCALQYNDSPGSG